MLSSAVSARVATEMRESEKRQARIEGKVRIARYVKRREAVFGMVESGGRLVALHVPSRYGYTIRMNVDAGCSLYADEFRVYDGLGGAPLASRWGEEGR
jgi:hypothetical protein